MIVVKGDTVVVNDPATPSNGSTSHAAIVTAVHGEERRPLINAKVFPDGGHFYNVYSVYHQSNRDEGYEGPTWVFRREEGDESPDAEAPVESDGDNGEDVG